MNNEYYMKYVNNYINNYISITNNVFVALHSFLQFYDKAVLLQQTHWGHEIIKGSGGLCLTGCLTLRTLGRSYSPRNWISWCVFLVSSLERLHEDSAFHHHHDEPQGLCPRAKHPQCHGHENAKLNHRWSNIVPWEEWVHVDTIKALLLHFGGVSWACTEPSSDPSPSGALGDRITAAQHCHILLCPRRWAPPQLKDKLLSFLWLPSWISAVSVQWATPSLSEVGKHCAPLFHSHPLEPSQGIFVLLHSLAHECSCLSKRLSRSCLREGLAHWGWNAGFGHLL